MPGTVNGYEVLGLCATSGETALAAGDAQIFDIDAGPANAGKRYLVGGSASGKTPGAPVGSLQVSLNLDACAV